jgi:hypothetical protein
MILGIISDEQSVNCIIVHKCLERMWNPRVHLGSYDGELSRHIKIDPSATMLTNHSRGNNQTLHLGRWRAFASCYLEAEYRFWAAVRPLDSTTYEEAITPLDRPIIFVKTVKEDV